MKKLLLVLGFTPILVTPVLLASSCSTLNKETDFKSQYNLFTPELVKETNVSKNLAFSIDDTTIDNIYSVPQNLQPSIDYSFTYLPSKDGKTLSLFVQLYDYKGVPVKYSNTSTTKEIAVISGFKELTIDEQEDINLQYQKFQDLTLKGDSDRLPSSVIDFVEIDGSNDYIQDSNYKYNFELNHDDNVGELSIKLNVTSLDGYPLNPNNNVLKEPQVLQFMNSTDYQTKVDSLYIGENEIMNINLDSPQYSSINQFASSITNSNELVAFYEKLKELNPSGNINIPNFLTAPDNFEYYPNIKISSSDFNRSLSITIDFYDRTNGNLLIPSSNINKVKRISNFKLPSNELLKATMDAYNKYSKFNASNNYILTLPTEISSEEISDISKICDIPIEYLNEFTIVVDNYGETETPGTSTFNFRPTIKLINRDNVNGSIIFAISLKVKLDEEWLVINPPSKLNVSNGEPSFSETKNENSFSVIGFFSNELKKVNDLYTKVNEKIQNLNPLLGSEENNFLVVDPKEFNFYDVDFVALWSSLYNYNSQTDPLGIEIGSELRIDYSFIKSSNTQGNYDVSLSTIDNKIYKWVKVKARVYSTISGFEYEFLTEEGVEPPTFEFNFAISIDK